MESVAQKKQRYQALARQIVQTDATNPPSHGHIEALALIDEGCASYMVMYIGWSGIIRHHDVVFHIRVRDGKFWIERDGTEEGVANTLLAAGVPHEDIVLAFHPPHKRPLTDFAVA